MLLVQLLDRYGRQLADDLAFSCGREVFHRVVLGVCDILHSKNNDVELNHIDRFLGINHKRFSLVFPGHTNPKPPILGSVHFHFQFR